MVKLSGAAMLRPLALVALLAATLVLTTSGARCLEPRSGLGDTGCTSGLHSNCHGLHPCRALPACRGWCCLS